MKALTLVRWIAANWAREPWKWALLIALMALWPTIQVLAPFGGGATNDPSHAIIYELAFLSAGVGAACALDALEVLPACTYRLGLRPGWPAEWIAMTAMGLAVQMLVLSVPLLLPQIGNGRFAGELAARASLSSASAASVGVLLLRIQMPVGSRALVLLVLTWVLPAVAPSSLVPDFLGAMLRPTMNDPATQALVAGRIASISALLLGAHLMDAQRRHRP